MRLRCHSHSCTPAHTHTRRFPPLLTCQFHSCSSSIGVCVCVVRVWCSCRVVSSRSCARVGSSCTCDQYEICAESSWRRGVEHGFSRPLGQRQPTLPHSHTRHALSHRHDTTRTRRETRIVLVRSLCESAVAPASCSTRHRGAHSWLYLIRSSVAPTDRPLADCLRDMADNFDDEVGQ